MCELRMQRPIYCKDNVMVKQMKESAWWVGVHWITYYTVNLRSPFFLTLNQAGG